MFDVVYFSYVVAAVIVATMLIYVLAWAGSRGWHRGKREFLARLHRDHCGE